MFMAEEIILGIPKTFHDKKVLITLQGKRLEIKANVKINYNEFSGFRAALNNGVAVLLESIDITKELISSELKSLAGRIETISPLFNEQEINDFYPHIKNFSLNLAEKIMSRYSIVVRYNNDADGIASALALENLPGVFIQHNAPIYNDRHANNDILTFGRSSENKLLLLLDLGSNEDSLDGIMLGKQNRFETFIIDHHPLFEAVEDYATVLNPWKELKKSDLTSGYLACEVGRLLGILNDSEAKTLAQISFAGDKSKYLSRNTETERFYIISEIFDYICHQQDNKYSLDSYKNLISEESNLRTLYSEVIERKEKMRSILLNTVKTRNIQEITVKIIPLKRFENNEEFTSMSKVCTTLLEEEIAKDPEVALLVIGLSDKRMIFRASPKLIEQGFSINDLIGSLKETELIDVGGGHAAAGTISFRKGLREQLLQSVYKHLERFKKA